MSKEGNESNSLPQFRKFVSEAEVEDKRKKRQEEWEKVRKPQDPIEAPPEEPEDHRSLYDRLQEQKNLKQAEYEEKFNLKNQVRGLDDEEAQFLDEVNRQQELVQRAKEREEEDVLTEYRTSLANRVAEDRAAVPTVPRPPAPSAPDSKQRPTQSQLLSGAVKRKRSDNSSEESPKEKEGKLDKHNNGVSAHDGKAPSGETNGSSDTVAADCSAVTVVAGVLPGIGVYTDSDDSDSSSDSDIDTDLFKRTKVVVQEQH